MLVFVIEENDFVGLIDNLQHYEFDCLRPVGSLLVIKCTKLIVRGRIIQRNGGLERFSSDPLIIPI